MTVRTERVKQVPVSAACLTSQLRAVPNLQQDAGAWPGAAERGTRPPQSPAPPGVCSPKTHAPSRFSQQEAPAPTGTARGEAHLDEDALPAVVDPAVAQGARAAGVDLHASPLDRKARQRQPSHKQGPEGGVPATTPRRQLGANAKHGGKRFLEHGTFPVRLPPLRFQEAAHHASLRPRLHTRVYTCACTRTCMHTTLAKGSALHYCSTPTLHKSIF